MVYLILTRRGYEEVLRQFQRVPSPVWVNKDILSADELASLRAAGTAVTDFTRFITPSSASAIEQAAATVREHHPNDCIWVEYAADL
jgi:hypothetical protein